MNSNKIIDLNILIFYKESIKNILQRISQRISFIIKALLWKSQSIKYKK